VADLVVVKTPIIVRRKAPMASQYVGIDLHRRRSVIVRKDAAGEVLEQVRIDNDPVALACAIEKAGPDPEVVLGGYLRLVLGR
jgi:hypothetical protein